MPQRPAAVAGTWYPASASRLEAEVRRHLRDAEKSDARTVAADGDLIGLIAPHAGLVYSGPVAAYAYGLLQSWRPDLIVLVGPSHYVPFAGVSAWPAGAFDTPFGPMTIDEAAARQLMDRCPLVQNIPEAHRREHSLEMQLPFLALLCPDVPILPLVMGWQTRDTAFALGDALAAVVSGRRALLVASSDLTHFLDAESASRHDAVVIGLVEGLDAEGLMAALEARPEHACGGGPMVSVLRASQLLGATRGEALQYADSGDVSGDKSSVVGYLAAALWK
jgi:AmmeMemoRadiSam system protein B